MLKPVIVIALANSGIEQALVACANEFKVVNPDKPIRIPYGDYSFGTFKMPDGGTLFLQQRVDAAAASAWQAALANELGAGGFGIPVYHGHPDVPDLAHKYPDKRAHGWANRIEADPEGVDVYVAWNEEPGKAFAYFSPFWEGPMIEKRGMTGVIHMTALKSIALVNSPNIQKFRLPNESAAGEDNTMNEAMKKFLCELLKLDPATTTDEQLQKAMQTMAEENASLKAAADASKAEATTAKEAEANANVACANERQARIDLMVTQAVSDGRISVAGKPAWQKNLTENFDKYSVALANEKPALKTESETKGRKPAGSDLSAQGKIIALVNEAKGKGMSHDAAYAHVKANNAALFALPA